MYNLITEILPDIVNVDWELQQCYSDESSTYIYYYKNSATGNIISPIVATPSIYIDRYSKTQIRTFFVYLLIEKILSEKDNQILDIRNLLESGVLN